MSIEQVMQEIERDLPFYEQSEGGVTFSGGEPLSQSAFLLELLKACKRLELHTALDTSGLANWQTVESVRAYVDLFLYDVKIIDDQKHRRFTGVSNKLILENLEKLANLGHQIIIRTPVVPGITDGEENLRQIGALAARLPGVVRLDLLPYHPTAKGKYENLQLDYALVDMNAPDEDVLARLVRQLEQIGINVRIGG